MFAVQKMTLTLTQLNLLNYLKVGTLHLKLQNVHVMISEMEFSTGNTN